MKVKDGRFRPEQEARNRGKGLDTSMQCVRHSADAARLKNHRAAPFINRAEICQGDEPRTEPLASWRLTRDWSNTTSVILST